MTRAAASAREERRLWISAFVPVVAFGVAQQLDFVLSPWVCATGNRWVLSLVTSLAFLAAAAGGLSAWQIWSRLRGVEGDEDPAGARRRFLAAGALLLSAVFSTAIVALAIPVFFHRPCD